MAMTPAEMDGLLGPAAYDRGEELPCAEWGRLEEGDYVIVQRDRGPLIEGEVDVIAHDASVFWVWLDGGRGRISVYADEGIRVWLPRAIGYELQENSQEHPRNGR